MRIVLRIPVSIFSYCAFKPVSDVTVWQLHSAGHPGSFMWCGTLQGLRRVSDPSVQQMLLFAFGLAFQWTKFESMVVPLKFFEGDCWSFYWRGVGKGGWNSRRCFLWLMIDFLFSRGSGGTDFSACPSTLHRITFFISLCCNRNTSLRL